MKWTASRAMICESVPEIHTVLDVTDHAAGTNPTSRAEPRLARWRGIWP